MTRRQKLIEKAMNSPAGFRFKELCLLAEHMGFQKRGGKGSHVVYERDDVEEILTFQNHKGMGKPCQVKQMLVVIGKYRLGERE
jgi:predicted RNA binding protein YcfA (HicA-like mRNA interferase family)